jgi:hypothetical protein
VISGRVVKIIEPRGRVLVSEHGYTRDGLNFFHQRRDVWSHLNYAQSTLPLLLR